MLPKRRKFNRPLGERSYRKLFVIATEGTITEPQYFSLFTNQQSLVRVKCLKRKAGSSPPRVLKCMSDYIKEEGLRASDEAWLVVDKDQWTEDQLKLLQAWTQKSKNYGFALSNPKFEYWLLLHFEDAKGIHSSRECSERLKNYLPEYDKKIDVRKFTQQQICDAINRAEQRDTPPCADWPRQTGTTVYKLVAAIQKTVS